MALSSVQIANFALSKIGDSLIGNLAENSTESDQINLWFDLSRQETLAGFNWGFARKRQTLAAHADDPPDEWAFRYIYPADCLSFRSVENVAGKKADPIPFEIEFSGETKSILTDAGEAIGIYTLKEPSLFLYTPYFIETFATFLASHIAFPLAGQPDMAQALEAKARAMLVFASAIDANEKREEAARDAPWTRGR